MQEGNFICCLMQNLPFSGSFLHKKYSQTLPQKIEKKNTL